MPLRTAGGPSYGSGKAVLPEPGRCTAGSFCCPARRARPGSGAAGPRGRRGGRDVVAVPSPGALWWPGTWLQPGTLVMWPPDISMVRLGRLPRADLSVTWTGSWLTSRAPGPRRAGSKRSPACGSARVHQCSPRVLPTVGAGTLDLRGLAGLGRLRQAARFGRRARRHSHERARLRRRAWRAGSRKVDAAWLYRNMRSRS